MVKKSNVRIPMIAVLRVIVFLMIGLIIFVGYSKGKNILLTHKLFEVADVDVERSIEFIDRNYSVALKGQNIFKVDLNMLHQRIKRQYPQIADLHIIKEMPNHIKITAKKRNPAFVFVLKGKYLLVDAQAVAMYYVDKPGDLPIVFGPFGTRLKFTMGSAITWEYVQDALNIIKVFSSQQQMARLKLTEIDLSNRSRYVLTCSNGFKVFLDQENYKTKLNILNVLLTQRKIDFNAAKYVDLRFNEPVLGENVP